MARRRELNNVNETWDRNEQLRSNENTPGNPSPGVSTVSNDLERTIREEAAEYDSANKEDRLLDGDRATVNDSPAE